MGSNTQRDGDEGTSFGANTARYDGGAYTTSVHASEHSFGSIDDFETFLRLQLAQAELFGQIEDPEWDVFMENEVFETGNGTIDIPVYKAEVRANIPGPEDVFEKADWFDEWSRECHVPIEGYDVVSGDVTAVDTGNYQ